MEKDIVERLDSMSGLSDRDSDTRNDAVLYINILRQKFAQQSVQPTLPELLVNLDHKGGGVSPSTKLHVKSQIG